MSIVISILNHKGGVGKTTSAVNIGAALVQLNRRVLLVDLDPQANLTLSLRVPRQKVTLYECMVGESELQPYSVKEGLDVVSSNINLAGIDMALVNEAGREYILGELFEPLRNDYDYIIIDCPPSLGLLTTNALTTSNYVMIPMQTEFLSMQGITQIKKVTDKVRFRLNKQLQIGGVVATMYDHRKVLNRETVDIIKKFFKEKVFKTKIRSNIALAEAPSAGMDIFEYNGTSNGAEDYMNLTKEIVARFETVPA